MRLLLPLIALAITMTAGTAVELANDPENEATTEPVIRFVTEERQVRIYFGEQEVADYVFEDNEITRPYFARVKTLAGKQVSRNHPPREGDFAVVVHESADESGFSAQAAYEQYLATE